MSEPSIRRIAAAPAEVTGRLDVHEGREDWRELGRRIGDLAEPHGAFYLLVVLSTTIAAFGLLANSTAVVIGAMLVAPLMGPIFGIAFGLATGDAGLLGRAVAAELKGMALAVGLAVAIGLLAPQPPFGSEILGRTTPTLFDVFVAVASGLAGAFALADRRVSPALPGVAIATAIVPPLATVGLCISAGRVDLAGGAFLLFLANLVAIELAAVALFTWVGVRRGHLHEHFRLSAFLRHFAVSLVLLAVIGTFLTGTLRRGLETQRRREAIREALGAEVRVTAGARLTDLQVEEAGDTVRVLAMVLTPQEFTPDQVGRLEDVLRQGVAPRAALIVRSLLSRDANRLGPVYLTDEEVRRRTDAEAQTRALSQASKVLRARFREIPGVELEDLRRTQRDSVTELTAVVRSPASFDPVLVGELQDALRATLGAPVHLVVRAVLARDVDTTGFLHEPAAEPDSAAAGAVEATGRRSGGASRPRSGTARP